MPVEEREITMVNKKFLIGRVFLVKVSYGIRNADVRDHHSIRTISYSFVEQTANVNEASSHIN